MKNYNFLLILLLATITFAFTGKHTEYHVDQRQSNLTWTGKKVTGAHTGNISLKKGSFSVDGKNVVGGSFTIDMTSITNHDLEDETYKQQLLGHLKSDDFFATEKYPEATLVLNKLTPKGKNQYQVKGNLTIKGITKSIEFPAVIVFTGNELNAKATILVDRTQYGIKYGSGSFFDNLGDKAINNEFELKVNLIAKLASTALTAQ